MKIIFFHYKEPFVKWKGTEKNLCFKECRFMGIKMCVDDIVFILTAPLLYSLLKLNWQI